MNLRWIDRDGKLVLQQTVYANHHEDAWKDVPIHKEQKATKKPREFDLYVSHSDQIKVIEVLPGYRMISREELLKAYAIAFGDYPKNKAEDRVAFQTMAKELGLDDV